MEPNALLRTIYRINAAATLVCGAVLLVVGGALSPVFAAPTAALATVGGLFVAFAGWTCDETPASKDSRSWLFPRELRQALSRPPKALASGALGICVLTARRVAAKLKRRHDFAGHGRLEGVLPSWNALAPMGASVKDRSWLR